MGKTAETPISSWRPDWRRAEAYEGDRTLLQWRWEFLRRRPDYESVWVRSNEAFARVLAHRPDLTDLAASGDPMRAWAAREDMARSAYGDTFRAFGLIDALNPAREYSHSDLQSFFARPEWGAPLDVAPGEVSEAYRRGVVTVLFDLRYDVDDQLASTKQMLLDERRNLGLQQIVQRIYPDRWRRYLRTIDAEDDGATLAEIGRLVLGHEDLSYNERASRAAQCRTDARDLQTKLTS